MLEVEERVEGRRHSDEAAWIPSREHHDRHRIGIRLGHAPEGIFRARAVLHRKDADLLTGRDPADRVGHVQARPFLAHDNGADVRRGGSLDDRVDGVADEEGHALALEYLRNGSGHVHTVPLLLHAVYLLGERSTPPTLRSGSVLPAPCRVARQGSRGARPTTNTAYHHVCTAGVPATRVMTPFGACTR